MRQVLVDHARAHQTGKRGGGVRHVSLDDALVISRSQDAAILRLDDALTDPRWTPKTGH
jgi:hypothetical protein